MEEILILPHFLPPRTPAICAIYYSFNVLACSFFKYDKIISLCRIILFLVSRVKLFFKQTVDFHFTYIILI